MTSTLAALTCCNRAADGGPVPGSCFDHICTAALSTPASNGPFGGAFGDGGYDTPITGSFDGSEVTLAQAQFECSVRGKRLCTAPELFYNAICCGYGARIRART